MREERVKNRKKRKIKFWVKVATFLGICAVLVFAFKAPFFNVKKFEVRGNGYYTAEEIINMGNCKTGKNIFIGTDCKDIERRLEKDAYMEKVRVRWKLPNTIIIELTERKQMAAIVYGSKFVVIDSDGTVLRKTSVEPKITIISGLTISKLKVGEVIEAEEKVLLRQTLEILESMNKNDMYFTAIEISKKEVKAHILKSLICKGTSEHIMEAMESKYLQLVIKDLFEKDIERGTLKISGEKFISFTPRID